MAVATKNCYFLDTSTIKIFDFYSSTKVFVWGLNDKDQLGGQKGSKIKLPVFSDTLSNLKPIHIAGGSKSLFIGSYCTEVQT